MTQLHPFVLLLAVCLLAGCDKPSPPPPATNTTGQDQTPDVAAATDTGTPDLAVVEPDTGRAEVRQQMQDHWGLAVVVRDAVIAATLDELPSVGGDLAAMKSPPGLAAHADGLAAMRAAGERAQKATSTREASLAVADLAVSCGDCHTKTGATPVLPDEPLPPDEDAIKAHMLRHDYAARELWAGLVTPSDERWQRGAAALAAKPLKQGDFFEDWRVTNSLAGLDTKVHSLRSRVAGAATRDARKAVFGELITNCSTCHAATAEGPVD